MASYTSKVIAACFAICNNTLKEIDRERTRLKSENHFPDVLGGTFDHDAELIQLRKDTGRILEIKQFFDKLKK